MPEEQFARWSNSSTAVEVKARARVFKKGDELEDLHVVCYGQIGLIHGLSGESFVGAVRSAGMLLGLREFILDTGFHDTAVAYSSVLLRRVPKKDFKWLFENSQVFAQKVVRSLAEELRTAEELLWACRAATVQKRIARILLYLSRSACGANDQQITLSRRQIAEIIRSSRETVTRRLAELRDLGVVENRMGEVVITNLRALERMAR